MLQDYGERLSNDICNDLTEEDVSAFGDILQLIAAEQETKPAAVPNWVAAQYLADKLEEMAAGHGGKA